ncbi:MAG: hypothetical protein ACOX3G_11755 [Armatimonadota bacterium]
MRTELTVVGLAVIMTPVVHRLGVRRNARAGLSFVSAGTSVWEDK